jgi:hypothetical protein
MALVSKLDKRVLERHSVHDEIDCTYTTFIASNCMKYLQITTYGSDRTETSRKSKSDRAV